jgi:hypothetical protein
VAAQGSASFEQIGIGDLIVFTTSIPAFSILFPSVLPMSLWKVAALGMSQGSDIVNISEPILDLTLRTMRILTLKALADGSRIPRAYFLFFSLLQMHRAYGRKEIKSRWGPKAWVWRRIGLGVSFLSFWVIGW